MEEQGHSPAAASVREPNGAGAQAHTYKDTHTRARTHIFTRLQVETYMEKQGHSPAAASVREPMAAGAQAHTYKDTHTRTHTHLHTFAGGIVHGGAGT